MKRFGIALVVCLAFAPVAMAQSGEALAAMDANGDGAITRTEAQAARMALFERVDADGDGYLSQAERANAAQIVGGNGGRQGLTAALRDADGDGRVSRAEVMAQPYRLFDRLDANHDNVVSAQEIATMRARFGQR